MISSTRLPIFLLLFLSILVADNALAEPLKRAVCPRHRYHFTLDRTWNSWRNCKPAPKSETEDDSAEIADASLTSNGKSSSGESVTHQYVVYDESGKEVARGNSSDSPLALAPGNYRIVGTAEGYRNAEADLSIGAGERTIANLTFEPAAAAFSGDRIDLRESVNFATGSAEILPESNQLLDEVDEILKNHPEVELLEIGGHTDTSGDEGANRELSQARAEAVREALIERGIDGERLAAKGYGEEQPLVTPDDTAEKRAKNRRVEMIVKRWASRN